MILAKRNGLKFKSTQDVANGHDPRDLD